MKPVEKQKGKNLPRIQSTRGAGQTSPHPYTLSYPLMSNNNPKNRNSPLRSTYARGKRKRWTLLRITGENLSVVWCVEGIVLAWVFLGGMV